MAILASARTLLTKYTLPLVIAVAFVLMVGGGLYTALFEQEQTATRVTHLIGQRMAISRVLSVAKDAETGQRGYLLTQNKAYLAPYNDAVHDIEDRMDVLKKSVQDDPKACEVMHRLEKLTNEKMAELKKSVEYTNAGDLASAMAIVKSGVGYDKMEGIRKTIYELHDISAAALEKKQNDAIFYERILAASIMLVVVGGLLLLLYVIRTLTASNAELVETAAARDQYEAQLRQSQKMEAIGQLTGGIAHDFNNLIAGISGSLELMRLNVDRKRYDKLVRYIDTAEHATSRASELTHRLLAFSRKQSLEPKQTCCNKLIKGMIDMLRRTLGPSIIIKTELAGEELWHVRVDPVQLESSILNLCINARDAMPTGTITIAVENTRYDPAQASERELAAGDYVVISVTDNGSGIPEAIVARIFDPFFTTKAPGSGTGLGLAMVWGFARQSGGQIRCHSQVGMGTTMRIILPRDPSAAIEHSQAPTQLAGPANGECILVVDDEKAIREILEEVLVDAGYRVITAPGGQEAIDLLLDHPDIDLVLTDIGMPISGRVVADSARALYPTMPLLFLTGFAASGLLPPEYLDSRMGIVTKPFVIASLLARIAEMIR